MASNYNYSVAAAAEAEAEDDEEEEEEEGPDKAMGIPEFWLRAMKNHDMLEEQVRATHVNILLCGDFSHCT